MVEETVQLRSRIQGIGPGNPQPGTEPGKGRADQAAQHEMAPAPHRPTRHHLLPRAAHPSPLVSVRDAVAQHPDHRLQHRAHRAAAPPKLCRNQRCGLAVAELDPQDGHGLEDLARPQIRDTLAVPGVMPAGAAARPTPIAAATRLRHHRGQVVVALPDHPEVGRKLQCEYTLDDVTWVTEWLPIQQP